MLITSKEKNTRWHVLGIENAIGLNVGHIYMKKNISGISTHRQELSNIWLTEFGIGI